VPFCSVLTRIVDDTIIMVERMLILSRMEVEGFMLK
jgi:hypothetical protein